MINNDATSLFKKPDLSNVGLIFVSPIIGLTKSMMNVFKPIADCGAAIKGVDIFDDEYEKRTFWKVMKLTMLPGSSKRRISFANSFPEYKIFDKIKEAIEQCLRQNKNKIILGGMSGGFIFAGRVIQEPSDEEIRPHDVRNFKNYINGLFGISPLIFYPEGVIRPSVKLGCIPAHIHVLLFFCREDDVIPSGTIKHAINVSEEHSNIRVECLDGKEFGNKLKPLKHSFFGGKDFVGVLKNPFWHPEAERRVLDQIIDFLKT